MVVIGLLKMNAEPVKEIPARVLVSREPLKVVVPVPAVCVIEAALMPWVETLSAETMLKLPTRVMPPISAPKVIDLPTAVMVISCAPSMVLVKEISPPMGPVFNNSGPVKVIAPPKEIVELVAMIDSLRLTDPPL